MVLCLVKPIVSRVHQNCFEQDRRVCIPPKQIPSLRKAEERPQHTYFDVVEADLTNWRWYS
jgi:hypothetical protein